MNTDEKNYYEILETPYDSSFEQIKENYTKAKNAYSTDSLALYSLLTTDECDRILNTIDEAYSILSDSHKRKLYDEAKGIRTVTTEEQISENKKEQEMAAREAKTPRASINKIVEKNTFSLNFTVDTDKEKKIEQCQDFSGEFLKEIREYKCVDLLRMSELTKISKTYIRYIEEENFTGLPATVYVRGFVYQYAKTLKLNPDLVAGSYLKRVKSARENG